MSDATHGGKGDRQRKVNKEQYDSNFDRIFKQQAKKNIPTPKPKRNLKG